MDKKLFTQIVLEFVSAIWEKRDFEKKNRYADIIEIGSIAHFLQSIRREKGKSLTLEQIKAYTSMYGLFKLSIFSDLENRFDIKIIEQISDGVYNIVISEYEEICSICYRMWLDLLNSNVFRDTEHEKLIEIIEECLIPQKADYIESKYDMQIIIDLNSLAIIQKRDNYYLCPLFFKEIEKKTLDLVTEYDIGNEELIRTLIQVNKSQGMPIEHLDNSVVNLIKDGGHIGLLLPIELNVDNEKKTFVFSNPSHATNSDLAYETAAYFRFNELYTSEEFGKLKMMQIYLEKLLNLGVAGDVTNIGRNYKPLELKGVIKVIPGSTSGRYRMEVLKRSTITEAKSILISDYDEPFNIRYKEPPEWIKDPATIRVSEIKLRKKAALKLEKLLRDY